MFRIFSSNGRPKRRSQKLLLAGDCSTHSCRMQRAVTELSNQIRTWSILLTPPARFTTQPSNALRMPITSIHRVPWAAFTGLQISLTGKHPVRYLNRCQTGCSTKYPKPTTLAHQISLITKADTCCSINRIFPIPATRQRAWQPIRYWTPSTRTTRGSITA